MTTIAPSLEAVEAVARERWNRSRSQSSPAWEMLTDRRKAKHLEWAMCDLTAALPHLAPQPRQSDEERVRKIVADNKFPEGKSCAEFDESGLILLFSEALASVRAEATLAGAAAEREACAKVLDERAAELRKQKLFLSDVQAEQLERCAAAIRARP